MIDRNFETDTLSFLESIANEAKEINVDHTRRLGPLNTGGIFDISASRTVVNQYSFVVPEDLDYEEIFDTFTRVIEGISLAYILKKVPGKELQHTNWDHPEMNRKHRLIGVQWNDPLYNVEGSTETREITIYSENTDLDTTFYYFMTVWAERGYSVNIKPGEEHPDNDRPRINLLPAFLRKEKQKPEYVPISSWNLPMIGEHVYLPESYSITLTRGEISARDMKPPQITSR